MPKWFKRFLLGIALGLALLALFLTGGFVLLHGTPSYYRKSLLTESQRAEAATVRGVEALADAEHRGRCARGRGAETAWRLSTPNFPWRRDGPFPSPRTSSMRCLTSGPR